MASLLGEHPILPSETTSSLIGKNILKPCLIFQISSMASTGSLKMHNFFYIGVSYSDNLTGWVQQSSYHKEIIAPNILRYFL